MKKIIFVMAIIVFPIFSLFAQESNIVIIQLNNGYSVKGELIEKTADHVKIKTVNGEMLTYSSSEYSAIQQATSKQNRTSSVASTGQSNNSLFQPLQFPLAIEPKSNIVSLGLGIGVPGRGDRTTGLPPILLEYEHVIKGDLFDDKSSLGIGGLFGFYSMKWEYYNYKETYKDVALGVKGYLHYQFIEHLDTYGALLLGIRMEKVKTTDSYYDETYTSNNNQFLFRPTVGARYFFNSKIAAMAEIGYGISFINLGVALKL